MPANSTGYSDIGLQSATTYYYRIVVFNTANSVPSDVISATTHAIAPVAPSALSATAVSAAQIDLTWMDNATNESGYTIERSLDQVTWAVVVNLAADSVAHSDTGLQADTIYYYRVAAHNVAGSALSNVASAHTHRLQAPPQAPTGTIATDGGDGTALVTWVDVSDNETGFEIRYEKLHNRRQVWQGTTTVGSTAADVTQFIYASGEGRFRYSVRAINASGASAWSTWSEVTVTTSTGGGGGKGGGKCNPKKTPC